MVSSKKKAWWATKPVRAMVDDKIWKCKQTYNPLRKVAVHRTCGCNIMDVTHKKPRQHLQTHVKHLMFEDHTCDATFELNRTVLDMKCFQFKHFKHCAPTLIPIHAHIQQTNQKCVYTGTCYSECICMLCMMPGHISETLNLEGKYKRCD